MFKIRILKPEFDTTSLCLQDSKFLRLFVMKTCFLLPRMRFSFILLLFVRKLLENVQLQLMFKLPLDIYFVKVPYSHNGCPCRTTNNYINQHQPTCTPQRFHLAGIPPTFVVPDICCRQFTRHVARRIVQKAWRNSRDGPILSGWSVCQINWYRICRLSSLVFNSGGCFVLLLL